MWCYIKFACLLFGFSNVCYMPLFVPSVLIFLPPLYTILICHCSQLLYHPSIKLKGLQLVIVVASYTQHGLWSWVPTANQLSNPTRRSFVIKDRWMYHILQPHFRLIVANERWTLSQNFPCIWYEKWQRGWAVDPPKKWRTTTKKPSISFPVSQWVGPYCLWEKLTNYGEEATHSTKFLHNIIKIIHYIFAFRCFCFGFHSSTLLFWQSQQLGSQSSKFTFTQKPFHTKESLFKKN